MKAMNYYSFILVFIGLMGCQTNTATKQSVTYYFDAETGKNTNNGLKESEPFKDFSTIKTLTLQAGDTLKLKSGVTFQEMLQLKNIGHGWDKPLVITSTGKEKAIIDAKGFANGILLENVSNVKVENIQVEANGGAITKDMKMRCGVLYTTSSDGDYENVTLEHLIVKDIFCNAPGLERGKDEVVTANGTQSYGWGIRVLLKNQASVLKGLKVSNCTVHNVAHTGIKLTGGSKHSIQDFEVDHCNVSFTGGPGIQMSKVKKGHIHNNHVDHSGSDNDSRKWGRGSGLWTWGSDQVLIEKNKFTNANGPGDSAGAHIDYNCNNIVLQYNYSSNNAGGFLEILGNNYNCSYRYNISVNDGNRTKGVDGAFQEGKVFWLSGFQGKKARKGPFNSYIYNNTIYVNKDITAKIAVDKATKGVYVANNIFHFEGEAKLVLGDQYTPDKGGTSEVENVFFKNNVFYQKSNWPKEVLIQPSASHFVDVLFANKSGNELKDFTPTNIEAIKNKGIAIEKIQNDSIGLIYGLDLKYDILGNEIADQPSIGAIEVF
ncbi:right-handed parallel beta-helix repeat-containing protein [Flammeovirga aprica]|uniref:Right-handed parallel beta-helix repeat-containing protein n=1 Tax=Flammeovirga aprica JL-4 TaxID=694437 RepID=A0A7X9XB77_9BACT|nr:right-handed parallel beta-helix repeat-containing protein [Flammeovirga aprica]NME70435.1 right-handed parallel beta-helix repeat-containing protein [Flammeovirga aprica JL-4]